MKRRVEPTNDSEAKRQKSVAQDLQDFREIEINEQVLQDVLDRLPQSVELLQKYIVTASLRLNRRYYAK